MVTVARPTVIIFTQRSAEISPISPFSIFYFFSHKSERACHPERSAPQARVAKDLLFGSFDSAHGPFTSAINSRSFARALRALAQDDNASAFVRRKERGKILPGWVT